MCVCGDNGDRQKVLRGFDDGECRVPESGGC